jgi:alkylhydroperoxidase/carboxymuconolactone decarboxylase family protein YurZ
LPKVHHDPILMIWTDRATSFSKRGSVLEPERGSEESVGMALSDEERRLLSLFTAIVTGEWETVRRLRAEAPPGEPDRAWREVVLQTHLFAGFPRLVQAFGILAECGGLGEAAPEEVEGDAEFPSRGDELFETIYGSDSSSVRAMLKGHHPDFGDWILQHAYSRVLSRPGLEARFRELLASCALAALGQERQLASHARGSLRCGAKYEELIEALEEVGELIGKDRLRKAKGIASRFREE